MPCTGILQHQKLHTAPCMSTDHHCRGLLQLNVAEQRLRCALHRADPAIETLPHDVAAGLVHVPVRRESASDGQRRSNWAGFPNPSQRPYLTTCCSEAFSRNAFRASRALSCAAALLSATALTNRGPATGELISNVAY